MLFYATNFKGNTVETKLKCYSIYYVLKVGSVETIRGSQKLIKFNN